VPPAAAITADAIRLGSADLRMRGELTRTGVDPDLGS
jgi:hypothetical protein